MGRVKSGLGVLGGSVTPAEGMLGSLVSICASPGTSWEALPAGAMPDTAVTHGPVWLMEEPQWICCLGSPRHPLQLPAPGFTVPKQQEP